VKCHNPGGSERTVSRAGSNSRAIEHKPYHKPDEYGGGDNRETYNTRTRLTRDLMPVAGVKLSQHIVQVQDNHWQMYADHQHQERNMIAAHRC
jgi:hypothetical protein